MCSRHWYRRMKSTTVGLKSIARTKSSSLEAFFGCSWSAIMSTDPMHARFFLLLHQCPTRTRFAPQTKVNAQLVIIDVPAAPGVAVIDLVSVDRSVSSKLSICPLCYVTVKLVHFSCHARRIPTAPSQRGEMANAVEENMRIVMVLRFARCLRSIPCRICFIIVLHVAVMLDVRSMSFATLRLRLVFR